MSLTLSCKLVGVFATICAVLLRNQAQDSVVGPTLAIYPHRISSLWRPFAMADYNILYRACMTFWSVLGAYLYPELEPLEIGSVFNPDYARRSDTFSPRICGFSEANECHFVAVCLCPSLVD